ncbi:hypothetical protein LV779_00135 [Streptomyces thinghirensis]|nr:hypothetical protein [Streptomyces thinghirensis]
MRIILGAGARRVRCRGVDLAETAHHPPRVYSPAHEVQDVRQDFVAEADHPRRVARGPAFQIRAVTGVLGAQDP